MGSQGECRRPGAAIRAFVGEIPCLKTRAAVRREKFIADTSGYVERLRSHIGWEEGDLFKRIDRMLDDDAPDVDVSEFEHIKDPVFELEIESGFRRLLDSLQATRTGTS